MNVEAVFADFGSRGILLFTGPSRLRVEPASKLTDADRAIIRSRKAELFAHLRAREEEAEIDRLARADGWRPLPPEGHPSYSVLVTCQRYGVALRISPENGDLIVGKAGAKADEPTQPWLSLLTAIEGHPEAVTTLVEVGWTLMAGFPAGSDT